MIVGMDKTYEVAEKLYGIFRKEVETREPPKTVWLSDTVYCGRKKIFAMKGMAQHFTEQAMSKIWLGIVVGKALQELGIASEVEVQYRGIKGRIDVLLETNEPMEIKTATNLYTTASKYSESHVEQLSRYCLATGSETGVLFYYVPGVKMSDMPSYRYRFDLGRVREITDGRIDMLLRAASAEDPFILPATWHSENFNNWECRQCQFLTICRHGGGQAYI